MKKFFALFASAATVLVAAVSCAKENLSAAAGEEQMVEMTVIASEKPESPAALQVSRTYLEGTSVRWNATEEKLRVFQYAVPDEGDPTSKSKESAAGNTSDEGKTMAFTVSFDAISNASFKYFAVYPSSSYYQTSPVSVNSVQVVTPANQTPSANSFDASADLLIAKPYDTGRTQGGTLNMQFARMVAIGKMTVKNLESSDPVKRIVFSAIDDGESVNLAGRTTFNLETGLPVSNYASNAQEKSLILDYSTANVTANSEEGMVAYFTCFPFSLTSGDSFTVAVETETQVFTKVVNLTGAQELTFKEGKSSVFAVNMSGIVGVDKAIDLRYACLTYEDYLSVSPSSSYGNVSVEKAYGDKWDSFSRKYSESISLRSASGTNDSYLKLPDFVYDINRVVVTLKSSETGKHLSLETSATSLTGTIESKELTSGLVYEFTVPSGHKTAYLRSLDFGAFVLKVEVYSGDDNRTVLSGPANVSASLNEDDDDITNSIDVSWDSVDKAGSYIISLSTSSPEESVQVEVDSSPYTITGLSYATTFSISVKAIPSDPYVYKESAESSATTPVSTGLEGKKRYTLIFNSSTMGSGVNSYSSTPWTNTYSGRDWSMVYFSNYNKGWEYVKCGTKNEASVASITTSTSIPELIGEVKLTISTIAKKAEVNSIKLLVDTSSDFNSANLQEIVGSVATGEQTFSIPVPTANCFYKLVFDCAQATNNGLITVTQVVYIED